MKRLFKFILTFLPAQLSGCATYPQNLEVDNHALSFRIFCGEELEQKSVQLEVQLPRPDLRDVANLPDTYALFSSQESAIGSGENGQFLFDESGAEVLLTGLNGDCGLVFSEQAFYIYTVRRRFEMSLTGGPPISAMTMSYVDGVADQTGFLDNAFFLLISNADQFPVNEQFRLGDGDIRETDVLIYKGEIISASHFLHGGGVRTLDLAR